MNYTELSTAIQNYTEYAETTFVSQIPTFIRQAEERIFRTILIPELRKNATSTLAAGSKYLARPSDFLVAFSLATIDASSEHTYLIDKDTNFIREAYPAAATTGVPKYYAQFDGDDASSSGHFLIGPTPTLSYTMELHYYFDPPSIVDSATSWLGDNAESALLYGSLVEAYTFMKGEAELLAQYTARYNEALGQVNGIARRSMTDTYRTGEPSR